MNAQQPGVGTAPADLIRALQDAESDAPFELVAQAARVVEKNTLAPTESATAARRPLDTVYSRIRSDAKLKVVRIGPHSRLYKDEIAVLAVPGRRRKGVA